MKLICFDCDSTLSEIEGVDELANARGPEIKQQIIDLTNQAMSGEVAIEEIFGKRLDIIQPTVAACEEVGQLYIDKVSKGAKEVIAELQSQGWKVVIISGGFVQPIEPFAKYLGIEEIYAVPLYFDENGNYLKFAESPTTRNGGKPEIIKNLIEKYNPETSIMVGDGVSDLECQGIATKFIGYGEYEIRSKVKERAELFALNFEELTNILQI